MVRTEEQKKRVAVTDVKATTPNIKVIDAATHCQQILNNTHKFIFC